jgi:hypothetical protein
MGKGCQVRQNEINRRIYCVLRRRYCLLAQSTNGVCRPSCHRLGDCNRIPRNTALGTGSVKSAEIKPAWQTEWEKTVEAAKKEGQVNDYITGWGAVLNAGKFQKRYPEIRVVGVRGQKNQIVQRVLAERRAGKYFADVVSAGLRANYSL